MLDILARNKQITIVNNIEPQHSVFADINAVSLIFRNLIGNAIKFTQPNGQIVIFSTQNNNKITIGVQDNGVGLSADKLKKFLKSKNAVSEPGTANEQGTGMGLKLCNEFVTINKGSFWAESIENTKTTFYFSLPKS